MAKMTKKGTKMYYDKAMEKMGYYSTKLDYMDQRKYSQAEMEKDDYAKSSYMDNEDYENKMSKSKKRKKMM